MVVDSRRRKTDAPRYRSAAAALSGFVGASLVYPFILGRCGLGITSASNNFSTRGSAVSIAFCGHACASALHCQWRSRQALASLPDDAKALLAQAEALRREAEAEEQALNAVKQTREKESKQAEQQESGRAEVSGTDLLVLEARLSIAKGKLLRLEASSGAGGDLEAARREVSMMQSQLNIAKGLEQGASRAPATANAPEPATAAAPKPAAAAPPASSNAKPRGAKTEAEWIELSKKFVDSNIFEQIKINADVGPEGRRKLAFLRGDERAKKRTFIVPGARVRLHESVAKLRESFQRFKQDPLNGFSPAKLERRGQECVVQVTFRDKTMTCKFDDGTSFDLPWEAVHDYTED